MFGEILRGVSRHVLDQAMSAASNRIAAGPSDAINVQEINGRSNINDVTSQSKHANI
jgi:hypothetical protein